MTIQKNEGKQMTIVEMKLPLPWLIGSASAILLAMGGLFAKMDSVTSTLTKIEVRADSEASQKALLTQTVITLQGDNKTQQVQIDSNKSEIAEIKTAVRQLQQTRTIPR